MARGTKQFIAKFEQPLIFIDGPQVVLLSAPAQSKLVGVAVNLPEMIYPFFAAQVSDEQFVDYLNEKFDLRYLLLKPDFRRHYKFDLNDVSDGLVEVERYKFSPEVDEALLPDAGIFSRDHTEPVIAEMSEARYDQTFGIDGKWDLPEFSRFYGQVTDLYSLFNSVDIFLDEQADIDRRQRVRESFVKPFEGGGSYVSLYDSLEVAAPKASRLQVEAMSYHSPGYVKVRGRQKPLAEVRALIEHIERNAELLSEDFKSLNKFMGENKLRRYPAARFGEYHPLSPALKELSKKFSDSMDAVEYADLLRMAGGNVLIAAKVCLSIYRRAMRLNEFFLQGRASFDVPSSQR